MPHALRCTAAQPPHRSLPGADTNRRRAAIVVLALAATLVAAAPSPPVPAEARLTQAGHAPAAMLAPADPFDPTVCQYPVRLEPICPEALPTAPATQP